MMEFEIDVKAISAAAEALRALERTTVVNRRAPPGVVDPRDAVSRRLPRLSRWALQSIQAKTPKDREVVAPSFAISRVPPRVGRDGVEFDGYEVKSRLPESDDAVVAVLEYGSVPHTIRPRKGKYLVFEVEGADPPAVQAPDGSFVVFTKEINHPGTSPHAMFRRTLSEIRPVAARAAREIVDEVAESFRRVEPRS